MVWFYKTNTTQKSAGCTSAHGALAMHFRTHVVTHVLMHVRTHVLTHALVHVLTHASKEWWDKLPNACPHTMYAATHILKYVLKHVLTRILQAKYASMMPASKIPDSSEIQEPVLEIRTQDPRKFGAGITKKAKNPEC